MNTNHLIVVGVDGSEGGRRALEWALAEAADRGGTVQAVTAWSWDGIEYGPIAATSPGEEKARAAAVLQRQVEAVTARSGMRHPVATELIEGNPADVLAAAARPANLLVLGSHGHSRVRHTVLGSVSEECVRKATCPVVVIPVPVSHEEPAGSLVRG